MVRSADARSAETAARKIRVSSATASLHAISAETFLVSSHNARSRAALAFTRSACINAMSARLSGRGSSFLMHIASRHASFSSGVRTWDGQEPGLGSSRPLRVPHTNPSDTPQISAMAESVISGCLSRVRLTSNCLTSSDFISRDDPNNRRLTHLRYGGGFGQ